MIGRKTNLLITIVFDENADIRKQIDTELSFKKEVIKDLQHLIQGKEIEHFVVAENEVINEKLTEDVVEHNKIDKAIKEIEEKAKKSDNNCFKSFTIASIYKDCLEIIKRNIGE